MADELVTTSSETDFPSVGVSVIDLLPATEPQSGFMLAGVTLETPSLI